MDTLTTNHYPAYARHWDGHATNWPPNQAASGLGDEYTDTIRPVLTAVAPSVVNVIFDIGCGAGLTYPIAKELWPDARYIGLDVSTVMIDHCERLYPDGEWWLIDRPNSLKGKADLIICHSVMTHIYPGDAIAYLDEIREHLHKNGRASISIHTDCPEGWRGGIGRIDYEPTYFEEMLETSGLEIVQRIPGNQLVYGVRAE